MGIERKEMLGPIRNISEEFLKAFCERVASGEGALGDPEDRKFFIRLMSKIDRDLLAWLFEKRFPLRPFVDSIDPKRLFPGAAEPSLALRKRWRLLKKRLRCPGGEGRELPSAQSEGLDANKPRALDTTVADLGPLVSFSGRAERVGAAWRTHGMAVTAGPATAFARFSPVMKHLYWGGAGSRKIAFWERLVSCQALELTQIRRLAHDVSRRTGRVVLSWHNASVGAAGGWGFENPALGGGNGCEVLKEAARIRKSLDLASAMQLWSLRIKRLFGPVLSSRESGASEPDKYEWRGPLALHQRLSRPEILAGVQRSGKSWAEGLSLLFALANQGRRMLDSGAVDSLVLPWIDKFFISSRRQADVEYLERLLRFVATNIESPLILFWDDTPHAIAPSLGLALSRMADAGLPFRGIGLFNASLSEGHGAEREKALSIISEEYPQKALFALRPMKERHCPGAYRRIFEELDESFFLNYDSSWKDNLAFLYAGTLVFPLLGTQTEMESLSPWIVTEGKRYGFGAWFRRSLRHVCLGKSHEASSPIDLKYCAWANLL